MIFLAQFELPHLLCLLFVSISTYFFVRALEKYAPQLGLLDLPNHRSAHIKPTPRGGGLAITASVMAAWWASQSSLLLGHEVILSMDLFFALLAVAVIGLIDDLRSVPWYLRLFIHCFFAYVLLEAVPYPAHWNVFFPQALIIFLLFFAIVWWVNLFNFMDGADGFASSEAIFLSAVVAIFSALRGDATLFFLSITLMAAVMIFLIRNRPIARIFLGDVGSGFLGAIIIALFAIAISRGVLSLWSFMLVSIIFWGDATLTLFSRILRGSLPWQAHSEHLYQKLARRYGRWRLLQSQWAVNLFILLPLVVVSEVGLSLP